MDQETEQRIEQARLEAQRQRDTADFLSSLSANDEVIKPVYSPEAWIIRDKARAAAERGEIPRTDCRHPLAHLRQFVDSDPSVARKDRPTNLYECQICSMLCWLVDPWGVPLGDQ